MKPKTMILMVVAVTCGLGASYMTSQLLADRGETPPTQEVPKVTVLVAKKPLSTGTLFKNPEDDFQPKQFEKGQEPANALTEYGQIKGERLKRSLRIGDYVSKDDLWDKNGSSLGDDLPKGMRAIGLPVNQLVSASGFANLPGAHVDILWTARGHSAESNFTKVLLENVKILAADMQEKVDDKKWVVASVVTVALPLKDALLASIAMDTGKMSFLLRNSTDDTPGDTDKATLADVLKSTQKDKGDDDPDGPPSGGKGAGRGQGPGGLDLPDIDSPRRPDAVQPVVPPPEQPKTHKLTILNGPTPITTRFVMDKDGKEVVSTDVTEAERVRPAVQPAPTVGPQQQPPAGQQPAGPQPASPSGKGQGQHAVTGGGQ